MRNIILIGPMGSGKTTIGKHLARCLRMGFFDSDQCIEERCGVDISTIFDIEGEDGFRKRETSMLRDLVSHNGVVIATGGGVIVSEENRILIRKSGFVVYLKTSVDTQYKRTKRSSKRPILATQNARQKLTELMAERESHYQQEADLIVESGERVISHITREIVAALET